MTLFLGATRSSSALFRRALGVGGGRGGISSSHHATKVAARGACCSMNNSSSPTFTSNSCRYFSAVPNEKNQKKKPFEKVMIANRGEIVQRVMRTCKQLDIATVAVYSTADAQAPFVQEADEAICLGPAAANKSYLNTAAVFQAIRDSGAEAVHPGYGFLSENAKFANDISEQGGAVWLGPSPKAILEMGDKLASKRIAQDAGVTIVPGYDKPLDSLEQALALANDGIVPYPVLLKAAAGGGGKGMRTCFNDRELKDAWNVSKAESLQFFGDDRLLLEKFIEKPHHIEFQILATNDGKGGTDVAVFPERECSIQRRNQKIIEESPSVLLHDTTRRTMAEQVVKLCKSVGYESAGTIEFLVDENQNFYFLEMNTRLQVEHCVTEEAVGGQIDLVKAMLWIGAGWGFPEELQALKGADYLIPPSHHAMEARIYAEDPLRGFLPSTGPLSPYIEPKIQLRKLRVDSGVAAGHVVTPHYDPMLSKVISSGKTRLEAIQNLSQAMDEYVIQGVQHNARLIQAVLRQPAFVIGDTPTSFLPTHFPDGFHGVELTDMELEEYAVAAALIDAEERWMLQLPALTGSSVAGGSDARTTGTAVIVRMGGFFGQPYRVQNMGNGKVSVQKLANAATATAAETAPAAIRMIEIAETKPIQMEFGRYQAHVILDGTTRTIQVLGQDSTGELKLQMYGKDSLIIVQSEREHELSQYMKEPPKVDTSSMVQSPMPGTLISFAVKEGDFVEEGQELCIVEAMKMQNILRSPKMGIIQSIHVSVGSSLSADQVILEFKEEEKEVKEEKVKAK